MSGNPNRCDEMPYYGYAVNLINRWRYLMAPTTPESPSSSFLYVSNGTLALHSYNSQHYYRSMLQIHLRSRGLMTLWGEARDLYDNFFQVRPISCRASLQGQSVSTIATYSLPSTIFLQHCLIPSQCASSGNSTPFHSTHQLTLSLYDSKNT
jgi:hypothetical protein